MIEAIRAWLNGSREFERGVALYLKYGQNADLKKILEKGETALSKSSLFHELRSLLHTNTIAQRKKHEDGSQVGNIIVQASAPTIVANATRSDEGKSSQPDSENKALDFISPEAQELIQACKREADILFKQLSDARARLFSLCPLAEDPLENNTGSVKVRGELAGQVISLQYKVDKAYARYQHVLQHGQLPETVPSAPVVNPMKLHQEISNLRKNISRYKNKISLTAIEVGRLQEMESRLPQLIKQYQDAIQS